MSDDLRQIADNLTLVAMSPEVVEALEAQGWDFGERGADGFHTPTVYARQPSGLREALEEIASAMEQCVFVARHEGVKAEQEWGWVNTIGQWAYGIRAALAAAPEGGQ